MKIRETAIIGAGGWGTALAADPLNHTALTIEYLAARSMAGDQLRR